MSLQNEIKRSLAAAGTFSSGQQVVEASDGPRRIACELVALDSLACAFNRLTLHADSLTQLSTDQLKSAAEQLSARLTYLLEPISPIEIDSQGCMVQLRSSPPQKDDNGTSYYELLVSRAGQISLIRYSRAPGATRTIIPAQVTREVLLRLVSDFAAVA